MKTIKIKNTETNKSFLTSTAVSFTEKGNFLIHIPNDYHQQFLSTGQMSVTEYKKKVLGL